MLENNVCSELHKSKASRGFSATQRSGAIIVLPSVEIAQ